MLKHLHRSLATASLAMTLVMVVAMSAWADITDPVNCVADPTNPACIIQLEDGGGSNGGGGHGTAGCRDGLGRAVPCHIPGRGWWGGDGCYYRRAEGDHLAVAVGLGGRVGPPAFWYVGSCGDPIANFWPANLIRYRVFGTDPGVTLLAQEAIRHLRLPAPRIRLNPGPPAPQVVFVPTWLWIDPVVWSPRSATASVAGLSVTAVGTPTRVAWSTGDGHTTICGRGTAWTSGADPKAASPDCGHVYTGPSRGAAAGRYTVTATISWRVTWSGGGAFGTEPVLTSTANVLVAVVEAAAVNTGP